MVWPCSIWPVRKKLWNQRGWPRNNCDGIGWWQKNIINNDSGQFCADSWWRWDDRGNTKKLLLLKVLPPTYTITDNSWSPILISQLFFSQWPTLNKAAPFLQPRCFWVDKFYKLFIQYFKKLKKNIIGNFYQCSIAQLNIIDMSLLKPHH